MSEITAIARPYAKAVFELALAHKQLQSWSEMLEAAALIARDPIFVALLHDPRVTQDQCAQLISDICGNLMSDFGKNFIHLLAANQRLITLPEIANLYAAYRAEYEKTIEVHLTTVFELDRAVKEKLMQALRIRLQRDVTLTCSIDKSLIGGAVIHAGDLVIDDSIHGKLAKLKQALA